MLKSLKWAIPLLITICCAVYLPYSAYNDVTRGMIKDLQEQENILAKQAARGIENLFENYWFVLDSMSKSSHIANIDDTGIDWIKTFCLNNNSSVKSITRVDAHGRIIYSFPHTDLQGTDLSDQDHIKLISLSHKTVFSDLFTAAQGFQTVAFHVPVFRNGSYDGTLGILVDYDYIAEKYLDDIRLGNDGYAWVISQGGIELYSQQHNHVGKPVRENYGNSPSVLSLAEQMQKGGEGAFHYISYENGKREQRYAAYYPVRLYNTSWSICVTAPEAEILTHIQGFRNRWIAVLCFLTAAGIGCSYYFLRFHLLKTEQDTRIKAEDALRESETKFRTLFEVMTEGVALHEIVYDELGLAADYRILSTNPAFEIQTGFRPDQIHGRLATEIYQTAEAPCLERFATVARTGEPDAFETTFLSSDSCFQVSVTSPKQGHFVTVLDNITERKKAEKALRDSEERYRKLFEMESDAIMLIDVETGLILDANSATSELYGYCIEELRSLRPVDISAEPEKTIQSLKESTALVPLRFHKKKDGTVFPVEITGRHSDMGGRIVNIAAIRDISDRLEAEKERKKLEDQLRQAQKLEAVGTLAGGIAHDFNNLLAPIIGYAEMTLLGTPDPSPARRDLEQILNAGIRASELVKQILSFSRFTREEEKTPIEIGSIVIEGLKLLRSSLPSTIEIRQNIEAGFAVADGTQIHQVLINLCTNAAQAMSEKGALDVSLKRVELTATELNASSLTTDPEAGDLSEITRCRYRLRDGRQNHGAHF